MKKKIIWLSLVLTLALVASAALAGALEPVQILTLDAEANTLTVDDHVYELVMDGREKPLRFEKDGGTIILFAQTTEGEIEVLVGTDADEEVLRFVIGAIFDGLADVDVAVSGDVESLLPARNEPAALCPQCQEPLSSGDHSKLTCGHYRCLAGDNHPVVCMYCNEFACNGADHSAVCTACGSHICSKDHIDKCINKKPAAKGTGTAGGSKNNEAKKPESYPGQGQTGPVGSDGTWYNPMYYFVYAPHGNIDRAYERASLKAEINKVLNRIERMENGERFGQKTLEELRKELENLRAQLDALN